MVSDDRYETPLTEIVEALPKDDDEVYGVVLEHYEETDELSHNDVLNLYDIIGYARREEVPDLGSHAQEVVDDYFQVLESDLAGLHDEIPLRLEDDVTPEQVRERYNDRAQWLAEGTEHHLPETSSQTLFLYSVKDSIVPGDD